MQAREGVEYLLGGVKKIENPNCQCPVFNFRPGNLGREEKVNEKVYQDDEKSRSHSFFVIFFCLPPTDWP